MIIIGLTGSIGMGKSATANLFKQFNIPVFDADKCVHEILNNNTRVINIINDYFPEAIVKNNKKTFIDRKILGNIVFKDNNKKKLLEKIIHPEVNLQRKKWLEFVKRQKYKIACFDIPLLFETKGEKRCDYVVVTSCPFFLQKQRVLGRNNMTVNKFYNILKNQINDFEKRKRAHFIINTGNGHRFSRNQVKKLIDKVLT